MRSRKISDVQIISARELHPHETMMFVVGGPAKCGKSSLLGDMCSGKHGKSLLLATSAREATSWKYQEHNVDTILFEDKHWRPMPGDNNDGEYVAEGYMQFIDTVEQLQEDDEYKIIVVDSGTELAELAWHEALMPYAAMDPAYFGPGEDRFRPYTALDGLMDRAVRALMALKTAPTPKHVGISWHIQPLKEETTETVSAGLGQKERVTKASSDQRAAGAEYEGTVLPMVRGRFRRRVFPAMDAVIFTHIAFERQKVKGAKGVIKTETVPRYMLQVMSDEERHCGLPGAPPTVKYVDNSWDELKKLIVPSSTAGE